MPFITIQSDMLLLDDHQPSGCRISRVAGTVPARLSGTVVAVTHDRYFLDNVAGWILELDRGSGIPWKVITRAGWNKKAIVCCRKKNRNLPAKAMKEELEWVRSNPKAAMPKAKHDLHALTNCRHPMSKNAMKPMKFIFHRPVWVMSLLKPTTSLRLSATSY